MIINAIAPWYITFFKCSIWCLCIDFKGNDFPEFYTEISSYENRNIDKLQSWIVKI